MEKDSADGDLYDHVGHDFTVIHEIVKSLVVGNSSTVVSIVQHLEDLLGGVQTQEYDEDGVATIKLLAAELDDEANHPETDLTHEDAARIQSAVDHALEAYEVAALKKANHPENQ